MNNDLRSQGSKPNYPDSIVTFLAKVNAVLL